MSAKKHREHREERRQYLCPQCFTVHFQNDVLFAANRTCSRCDWRQAAHRFSFWPEERFIQWCREGKTPVLLDWRTMPPRLRREENGVVMAVKDSGEGWVSQRVCPCCHNPLPPPCPVIFGWQGTRLCGDTAVELLQLAAEGMPAQGNGLELDKLLPLPYYYWLGKGCRLGVPAGLETANGTYGRNCRHRCCSSAHGAVVRLALAWDEQRGWDDGEAFLTIESFLKACGYAGQALKLPTVIILEGIKKTEKIEGIERTKGIEKKTSIEFFRQNGGQLERRIAYTLENVYFAAGWPVAAIEAVNAVTWLNGQISRLQREE